jgi:quinol monooxygenase YgiN
MKQKPVYTFAKWQIKEGHLQTVLDLLSELIQKSTSEEGNLVYKIHQSLSDSHTLILFEGYKDEKALDMHRGSEHFKNLVIRQIVPLLDTRELIVANEIFEN